MKRIVAFVVILFAPVFLAPAWAQVSATTGSINGKVSDSSGGVLPGVTVTIASANMQGTRTDTTSAEGEYRFAGVPPGEYRITYELTGFGTVVREGVRVGLGFTATVNTEMRVASLQETVTVSGESPVVDVSATTTATSFGQERLAALPNARDFWTVLAASPAIVVNRIDVGGSAAGTQTTYSAYDTKGDQHRPMVEGIVNTEGTGAAGFYYDYGAVDEVAVETKGHTAEMPWPGVWSNFISKSGGNQYHGKIYADYQTKGVQARNIDDSLTFLCPSSRCGELLPSDLNRLESYHDLNGDVGGYLKKDKLWWYGSLREQNIKVSLPNFPVKAFETGLRNVTVKGTYAISQNNKLTGYGQWGRKSQPNRLDTFAIGATAARHSSEESTWQQLYWGHTYKTGFESVLSDSTFMEIRGGQFRYVWPNFRYSDSPGYQDIGNQIVSGGNRDGWFRTPSRNQVAGSLTYFTDRWGGSHNFKLGGEWFRETFTDERGIDVDGSVPGDVLHILNNGAAAQVYLFASPSISEQGLRTNGLYVQDTWRVNSRFTLNLGIRYDQYRNFLPEQEGPPVGRFNTTQLTFPANDNVNTYNNVVPRLGMIIDLTGQSRTVLKANWGLYAWNPGTALSENVNDNPADWYNQYAWTDANANRLYDRGEEGVIIARRGGAATSFLDPNIKNTMTSEVSAWLEHELMPGFAVQGGYVYRGIDNFRVIANAFRPVSAYNVPITIRDPGVDGVLGNADDGAGIPGFNLSAEAIAAGVRNLVTNLPGDAEFHTVEFSANKRQTGRWSLQGSFAMRWNQDQDTGYFGNNLRSLTTPSTPNDLINTTNGGRYEFTMWTAKVNGSFDAPWGIRLTPALRVQQGQPFGRTFLAGAANGINYGSQRILAEPLDSQRQDTINILDLRAEKSFRTGSRRISVFSDIYNITNSNAAQNIGWNSGVSYLRPVSIIGPRIMRFGMKFDW
jgi:hypothetical protein